MRFVGSDGAVLDGRENVIAAHRDWFMNEDWRFRPEIVWTREEDGAGFALTRVQYTVRDKRERDFLLLFIFVDEDGAWKLIYDQSTTIV